MQCQIFIVKIRTRDWNLEQNSEDLTSQTAQYVVVKTRKTLSKFHSLNDFKLLIDSKQLVLHRPRIPFFCRGAAWRFCPWMSCLRHTTCDVKTYRSRSVFQHRKACIKHGSEAVDETSLQMDGPFFAVLSNNMRSGPVSGPQHSSCREDKVCFLIRRCWIHRMSKPQASNAIVDRLDDDRPHVYDASYHGVSWGMPENNPLS